jgi:hypothetical protein
VRIDLSVTITGTWVTPEVIADTASELADALARKLREVGHPVEPGEIGVRLDTPLPPDPEHDRSGSYSSWWATAPQAEVDAIMADLVGPLPAFGGGYMSRSRWEARHPGESLPPLDEAQRLRGSVNCL